MHICYTNSEVINMAEFCLDCLNKLNGTKDSPCRYVISWSKDLCEGCGQYKRVIIVERRWSQAQRLLGEMIENIKHYRNSK